MKTGYLLPVIIVIGMMPLLAEVQTASPAATKRALLIGISHYVPSDDAKRFIPPTYKVDSRFDPGMSWNNLPASLDDVIRVSTLLLQGVYGFPKANISILPEDKATHQGILDALDQLVDETRPGDTVVFYFSGHGSERLDSLSTKSPWDQTIVPIDAWKGIPDVRDKDLAVRFNQIVYEKKAHLTAIFDSCESATQARGIVPVISHYLAYDDRDVALDKKSDPEHVVVEADLKRIPQKSGTAVFLAAANPDESAFEARYPDDGQWHGAFTRALIRTLQATPRLRSADDVMSAVQAQLNADHQSYPEIPIQQVSVEGQHDQSPFGDAIPPHPLHVTVTGIPAAGDANPVWKLDLGSIGGFDIGTEFVALDQKPGGTRSVIRVASLEGPLESTATLADGDMDIKVGQTFEMRTPVYPHAAQLTVFVSAPVSDPASIPGAVKALFPGLQWVPDPSMQLIDFVVVHEYRGWVAYKYDGTVAPPGQTAKGSAYLVLPPSESILSQMRTYPPYSNKAYTFSNLLLDANYILATRSNSHQQTEFALMDLAVLAPRAADAFVHSPTTTPPAPGKQEDIDLKLSSPGSNEAVCRNDISLPVRTAWLHELSAKPGCDGVAFALTRRIVRLGKVRSLLVAAAQAPAMANWPYTLSLTALGKDDPLQNLPLRTGATYQISLEAAQTTLDAQPPDRKYLYLFGADCAGDLYTLYPNLNGVGEEPRLQPDGHWPSTIGPLIEVDAPGVSNPLGADTFFLMALPAQQKLENPGIVTDDGDLCTTSSRWIFMDMNALLASFKRDATKQKQQADWTIQQVLVPSRPR